MTLKLGSLFDGSGGFPLAGSLCGIEPIWASEVEPYPIAVTSSRFPLMEHLGSVTDINGAEVEPVDVITFGSPCQDLSVAGKRAGLKHEDNGDDETTRSGLFMEAIRIIKEMREATNGNYPKWAVWENVPGAFSSNKGEDFRTVLEELIKTVEPTAVMPEVPKNGWPYADCYYGDGWSIAYRVLNAQYIRTAQRRRRIYLVLHLTGQRAGSVLFERESLRGNTPQSGTPRKRTSGNVTDCTGTTNREGEEHIPYTMNSSNPHSGCRQVEVAKCLDTTDPNPCKNQGGIAIVQKVYESHPMDSRIKELKDDVCPKVSVKWHKGAADTPLVCEEYPTYCLQGNGIDRADTAGCNGKGWTEDVCYTLNTIDIPAVCYTMQAFGNYKDCGVASGLKARDYKDATDLVVDVQGMDCRNGELNGDLCGTLQAKPNGGFSYNCIHPVIIKTPIRYIVRRLTPTECARLQGFPDEWGHPSLMDSITDGDYRFWLNVRKTHAAINGKPVKDFTEQQIMAWYNKLHTDSAEYKMWGNGIALPCALYVMEGIAEASNKEGY